MLTALAFLSAQPALADETKEDDFSEVVLVWPDKFARWKDTRWLITTEIVVPSGITFAARNNNGFRTIAFQIKAIVACDQDYKLSGKKIEVSCKVNDFALKSTSIDRYKTQRGRDLVQKVLDEIDETFTGSTIQLQVNNRGSVTDIDLEGIPARNDRERKRRETLRQIAARMMYPFHMKLPKSGVREGHWPEFNSELMTMPSLNGIKGTSTIVHWMNFYKGYLLVQDIGEGYVEVTPPASPSVSVGGDNKSTDLGDTSRSTAGGGLGGGGGNDTIQTGPQTSSDPQEQVFDPTSFDRTLTYNLKMDGVSIYNIDNGVMEERVWSMKGFPTASNDSILSYWYAGRIQMLGEDAKPKLGATEQIGYPKVHFEHVPDWTPVDPEIAKDLKKLKK